ncbi:cadmium-translocating P-type ATPase [Pseudaminobacter arsenicus]|uniref:Cadmium-translocating P-type ATPase n=1 Tax=Borborobacter arsenicus TaxID=1851146 RepID=A0A432V7A3_9HYPH|nr:cation-translocating P-type ATPase [Pseudaminobacter arsenicus]RUM98042.1 cadmium-translocating P-type ATPase [Pseudaminobacter arsenicus]
MSCCAAGAEAALQMDGIQPVSADELRLASRDLGDGTRQTDLSVPGVHCGACIAAVEKTLSALPGVESARVNLSMKRVAVKWRALDETPPDLIGALDAIGYEAHLFSSATDEKDPELSRLIKALAVAGFSAMNIMLLSVSVWSGADAATRHAFHLISAALALPAVAYSGRIFYLSAWSVLRRGRTNMDVPISIGVSLAVGLSLYETYYNAPHAYFDAATSLLFFLLIGRTLDHVMRERARSAVAGLARLSPAGTTIIAEGGERRYVPIAEIQPGAMMLIAAGDRIPVDGVVVQGASELDCSLVTGESAPLRIGVGAKVQAGLMNLTGPLTIEATTRSENSFLAEMVRMMEAAEGGRARYRRLADRAAALYSPVVHTLALLTLIGWMVLTGDWHNSITIAIAVLIITCPCALGLAVPIVQVVAARRLFERGIMVKDGSALERLAEVDTVLFDKTGTLTLGTPRLINTGEIKPEALAIAAGMAAGSRHPMASAIASSTRRSTLEQRSFDAISEHPGLGIEARSGNDLYRLGRASWALDNGGDEADTDAVSISILAKNGRILARFAFEDSIRPGSLAAVNGLRQLGMSLGIISGDRAPSVEAVASALVVDDFRAGLLPADKVAHIAKAGASGGKVLMVGDGLNDAPALASAYVSMAPATAADIGRNAADFVFLKDNLSAVKEAVDIAHRAKVLIRQNFALAIGYNAIAVPVAVFGYVTPLVAAVAMSLSSVIVVANAMRLRSPQAAPAPADTSAVSGVSLRTAAAKP